MASQQRNETMNGEPVTEARIVAWAAEAEQGYDVETLKKRGRPRLGSGVAEVAAIRLDAELSAALAARAERDHSTRSEVVRDALHAWLKSA
jgi:hypothetical protein